VIITRTIGIDLGTTNSAVALLDVNEQDLVMWKDKQGRSTFPSCVWCNPRNGDIITGYSAYIRKGTKPAPISSIKRSMGTQMTVDLGGRKCSPSEISAYILQELKQQIEIEMDLKAPDRIQYDISRAIITVPAYFDLPAIEATRKAGELAGLEVMELLHEPTAAAIYYSWKHNLGDGNYLVYDLGGGTFDVSILRRTGGEFLVLGVSGDIFLGGDDFDRRLAEYLRTLLVADGYDLDLDVASDPEDKLRFSQLMVLAERAKKELSGQEDIVLRDQGTIKDKSGLPVIVETIITCTTFEELIDDLLDRTLVFCEDALKKAHKKSGITIENIDHILLVGGSTYVPAVFNKVKKKFCEGSNQANCLEPISDEPETAVTLGSALRAAAIGLGICDDDRQIMMWFRGTGTTKREQTTISGHIEPLTSELHLEGGFLRLSTALGDLLGEVELKSDLMFSFPKIDLQEESFNTFKFEILDENRKQVTVLQRSIVHTSDQKEAVGSTLSTAVLPKPILLEGVDDDRLVRQILLPEGTSLPTKSQFTFTVADQGGRIRLPIYQDKRIIKELTADIGNVAVGTPVKVEIECDEQVHIQVRFRVGDKEFGGEIKPPEADAIPTEYKIQQINQCFNEALQRLDKEDNDRLNSAYQKVCKDLEEAYSYADYPKVIQRAADLEGLVRDARLAEPLHPSIDVVVSNYDSCLELIPKAAKITETSLLEQELKVALEKAKQAYQQRSRQDYDDASQIIRTTLQFLTTVAGVNITENKDIDIAVRAAIAFDKAQQMTLLLLLFQQKGSITTEKDLSAILNELSQLREKVNTDPLEVFNRCQILITEAQRIYKQINTKEKTIGDLEDLLQLDAQKSVNSISIDKDLFGDE